MLPSLVKTKELYLFAITQTNVLNVKMGLPKGISAKHYQNVAFVAAAIAEATGLNVQKAYILGLLHDYGEYIEDTIAETFHGTAGYDEMMRLGFDEVARTCLSHSFFDTSFVPADYPAYTESQIIRSAQILKTSGFDDYDRLIHLADMMCPQDRIDTIENRIKMIVEKYHIPTKTAQQTLNKAQKLKSFFDLKCGANIYDLFGL